MIVKHWKEANHGPSFVYPYLALQLTGIVALVLLLSWLCGFQGGLDWSSEKEPQFNIHIFLMVFGMIFLYGNAMVVYRAFPTVRKYSLKLIHASVLSVVILFIILALYVAFDNHARNKYPDLQSLHAWVGLLTVILFTLQWLGGLVAFLVPQTPLEVRKTVMPWHVFLGCGIFGLALVSSLTGFMEYSCFYWGCNKPTDGQGVLVTIIGFILILFALLVAFLVTKPDFKRQPSPND